MKIAAEGKQSTFRRHQYDLCRPAICGPQATTLELGRIVELKGKVGFFVTTEIESPGVGMSDNPTTTAGFIAWHRFNEAPASVGVTADFKIHVRRDFDEELKKVDPLRESVLDPGILTVMPSIGEKRWLYFGKRETSPVARVTGQRLIVDGGRIVAQVRVPPYLDWMEVHEARRHYVMHTVKAPSPPGAH